MITLEEGKQKALEYIGAGLEISEASDLPDKWVFGFRDAKTKEEPDIPPVSVDKADGRVNEFFPPDHMEELANMKPIEL